MSLDTYHAVITTDPVTTASMAFAAAWNGDTARCSDLLAALSSEQLLQARAALLVVAGIALEARHIGGLT